MSPESPNIYDEILALREEFTEKYPHPLNVEVFIREDRARDTLYYEILEAHAALVKQYPALEIDMSVWIEETRRP